LPHHSPTNSHVALFCMCVMQCLFERWREIKRLEIHYQKNTWTKCGSFRIIIIIIIINYYSGLERNFSTLSISLVQALQNRLRLLGLYFRFLPSILLLLVLVTCRGQFDLCLPIFRRMVLFSNLPKLLNSFVVKSVYPVFFWKTWSWLMSIVFYPLFRGSKFRFYLRKSGEGQPDNLKRMRFVVWLQKMCIERFVFVFYWRSDCGQPWQDDLWSLLQFLRGTSSHCLQFLMIEHPNYLGIKDYMPNFGVS
jgi:hypothetical protein